MFSWVKNIKRPIRTVAVGVIAAMLALPLIAASSKQASWIFSGQSIANWRYQPAESTISATNVSSLGTKFQVSNPGGGDISATPSVYGGNIYYPDWAGNLFSVNASNGTVNWAVKLSDFTGIAGTISRSTPAVQGNSLIVGTLKGAYLLSINRQNGSLQWKTQLDSHPAAVLTQSPVVYNNMIYIGVSSSEEGLAANPAYPCCTFRGSFVEVNINSGAIMWRTYTTPDNGGQVGGYSGNAVWGSTAAIDPGRHLIYIGTGNNYTVPDSVALDPTTVSPTDYTDALLALNMASGQVVWADPLMGITSLDSWTVACFTSQAGSANCPSPEGPDYDFGQGPMLITANINGVSQDLVVDGQKSGIFWAVNADTGAVVWSTNTGAGSSLGGMEWGSATDGTRIYLANAAGGFWEALDPATGSVIWKTNDPNPFETPHYVKDIGPVSVANGVVYAGSIGGSVTDTNNPADNPTMFALNAATGQILWSFVSGSSVGSGPAIANGVVYWGTGYSRLGIGIPAGATSLFAFSIP